MTNNRTIERRTLASEVRHLSILERRCDRTRRRLQRTQIELAFTKLHFHLAMGGIVISWILFVSEVLPK